eukprot:3373787-Rhodomonas_salina.2
MLITGPVRSPRISMDLVVPPSPCVVPYSPGSDSHARMHATPSLALTFEYCATRTERCAGTRRGQRRVRVPLSPLAFCVESPALTQNMTSALARWKLSFTTRRAVEWFFGYRSACPPAV